MKLSKHARQRAQQRGLPENALELVFTLGIERQTYKGATRYELTKRACEERIRALRYEIALLEKARGTSVLACDDTLITTYRRTS